MDKTISGKYTQLDLHLCCQQIRQKAKLSRAKSKVRRILSTEKANKFHLIELA